MSAQACFPEGHGLGIRRPVLHRLLIERALADGVVLRWATPVTASRAGAVRAGGRSVRCRWVVGADGQFEGAAVGGAGPGMEQCGAGRHAATFSRRAMDRLRRVHWRDRCQAYVTPVGSREICLALIGDKSGRRFADLPTLFPELGRRLAGAQPTSSVRGAISVSTRLRRVIRRPTRIDRRCLGMDRRDTGEGLALAFRQATMLAETLSKDELTIYEAAHRRIGRMPRLMSRLMLGLGGRAGMRRRALGVLAAGRARSSGCWRCTSARYGPRRPPWTCRLCLADAGGRRGRHATIRR